MTTDMTTEFSPPLRIVLCRADSSDSWGSGVARDLELALMGDPEKNREECWEPLDLASGVPLGGDVKLRSFAGRPGVDVKDFLNEVHHTLVIVLVEPALLNDPACLDWLSECARDPGMDSGRHQLLAVVQGEETKGRWVRQTRRRELTRFQAVVYSELGEDAERPDWLALRALHEGVRLVACGAGAPSCWKLRLFVSHAKRDGLALAKSLRDLLKQIPWMEGFYDARDLGSHRPWDRQLQEAVASSVLVSLRTDIYDHRAYCQKEVMWAEEHGAPMVLVDARGGLIQAASCLPFESAPCVRIPDGNLVRVLHAALRVALRSQAFVRRVAKLRDLETLKASSIHAIPVSPGMSTLVTACEALEKEPEPRILCYPEPRLPRGRLEAAKALAAGIKARLGTPAEILHGEGDPAVLRPLKGMRVGISISKPNDLAGWGFTEASMNRLNVRFTRALLEDGATLAFGHDWRDKGIMDAVCRAALSSFGFPGETDPSPRILNLLPWPKETSLSSEVLERLSGILDVREAGLPVDFAKEPPPREYAQARGLTYLRRQLTTACQARICLGGKDRDFEGRYPGILEEALLALEAGQPLYLVGFLGGLTGSVGRAILDQKEPEIPEVPEITVPSIARVYPDWAEKYPSAAPADPRFAPLRDEAFDLQGAWKLLREIGPAGLQHNGLSEEENRRLLATHLEDEAVHLVLKGLRNVRSQSATAP